MKDPRPYKRLRDETLITCRHTALIPLEVQDRGDGYLLMTKANCGNCGAILRATWSKA